MYYVYIPYFFISRLILPRNKEFTSLSQLLYYLYSSIVCLKYVLKSDYDMFGYFDTKYSYIFQEQISFYFVSIFFQKCVIMYIHNTLILLLLFISHEYSMQNIAILLLLIHDCPEPFLHLAKLLTYFKVLNVLKNFLILNFAFIFMITRIAIISYIYYLCIEKYGIPSMFTIQIVSLLLLYVFWVKIISNVDYRLTFNF
jgi:hypothetical protein